MTKTNDKNDKTPAYSIDDFVALDPVAKGYELQPGKFYLIVGTAKNFNYGLLNALFEKMRDEGVQFGVHIVQSLHPKSIAIMEKKDATETLDTDGAKPAAVAGGETSDADRREDCEKSVEDDQAPVQRALGYGT